MRHRLGEHRLPRAGRPVQQDAARRVDANLLVEVVVRQRQLDGLADLLLLYVHTADIVVADVRLLVRAEHRDRRVRLRRQHVHDGVRVAVQRDRRAGLEQLAVDGAEDAHVVVGAGRRADDAVVVVDDLEELADDERHGLDALDLLLGPHQLALQVLHFVLDVILLDLEELELPLQRLHLRVEVDRRLRRRRGRRVHHVDVRLERVDRHRHVRGRHG
mmetsp:Transcript_19580/g.51517  ORF Transcript_19580/g.51517 Transcript_19580/m.51517 type:complete len:217 (-) Transcript_19580:35-685(-)